MSTKLPAGWKDLFLEALRTTRTIRHAAESIGVHRSTVYRERERDQAFDEAIRAECAVIVEELEQEALRRALDGIEKPIFYKGERVDRGEIREYSDDLIKFLLRAHDPKYREAFKVEHSGRVGVDLSAMSDDQLKELAEGLDDKRSKAPRRA